MIAKFLQIFYLIIAGVFLLTPCSFNAQKSRNLSIKNGLPSNSIRVIYKAKSGLLWIGTDAGLCSYDGQNIKVFDENNGLPGNLVWSITEDRAGHLWIGCYNGGICYYDGVTFKSYTKEDGLPSARVRKLIFKDDLLFISTDSKLVIFDGNKFYYKKFMMQVMSVIELDTSKYVISRALGTYKLTYDKDSLHNFKLDSCGWYGSLFGGVPFQEGLLLFKDKKLIKLSKNSLANCNGLEVIKSNSVTWDASVVNDSSVYLAQWGVNVNNGGLFRFNGDNIESLNEGFGLNSRQMNSLYYDDVNNILWVGTLDRGLYILFLNHNISYQSQKLNNANNKFISNEIIDVKNDNNNDIWCLKNQSLFKYEDGLMNQIFSVPSFKALIKSHPKWKKKIASSKINIDLVNNELNNFQLYKMQIVKDDIFISSDHGVFKYNITNSTWDHNLIVGKVFFVNKENELILHHPYSYLRKHKDIFDENIVYTYKIKDNGIPRDITKIIDFNDDLWYSSSSKGLIKQVDSSFVFYKNILNETNINHLISTDSLLYFSTQSGKVYAISEIEDSLNVHFTLTPDKDLVGNYIYFLSYINNKLFIGTNKGLNIYHNNQLSFIDNEEGYFENEILCSENFGNKIYLGSKKGFTIINSKLDFVKNSNKLQLNSLRTIDSIYLFDKYLENQLVLDYDKNYFTVDYSYPNLINHKKDQFTISFEYLNSHQKWSESSNAYKDPNKSTFRFLNLSPGEYRIAISVRNSHSNEYHKSEYFYFTVDLPYWKTWPFYIIITLTLVLIIGFIISKKIEEITEREKANRRIAEVRMEALKSQMNPHFTFNVMNSIQNFVIENDIDNALYFISSFSKLIRTTLDQSFKRYIPIKEELDFLNNYVEIQNMRFDNMIDFQIEYPKGYEEIIKIPPMIIQPLIENIFIHAFNKSIKSPKVKLKIYQNEEIEKSDFINVELIDNGLGRKNTKSSHVSRGSQIIEERLSLLNKVNNVKSQLNYIDLKKGTQVKLNLPIVLS